MTGKNFIICFVAVLSFYFFTNVSFAQTDSIPGIGLITPTVDKATKFGYYIPIDMKECLSEIDKFLPDAIKEDIEERDIIESAVKYKGLAQWIYQKWDLENIPVIVNYFMQYGFKDGADIAQLIYESYLKYKKDLPLRLEVIPKVYSINKNLFLIKADSIIVPKSIPNPKGVLNFDSTAMQPQFNFMGGKFTLIDSIYDPILKIISENGFIPSQNLWYVWWTPIAKFGEGNDTVPYFLTEEELNTNFDKKYAYNADFILIFEDADTPIPVSILRDNKFDFGFYEYLSTRRHFGFYLIRQRDVVYFE